MSSLLAEVSGKIGRTSKVQFGQIAGAAEPRFPHNIPAMKVPCMHATLLALEQALACLPVTSRMFPRTR
ncbi:MAG TPA: hypothetical protein VK466_14550, partial [Terriglobales bacterium]|nr:hypothetical protein [Terriglobales bacterium]